MLAGLMQASMDVTLPYVPSARTRDRAFLSSLLLLPPPPLPPMLLLLLLLFWWWWWWVWLGADHRRTHKYPPRDLFC